MRSEGASGGGVLWVLCRVAPVSFFASVALLASPASAQEPPAPLSAVHRHADVRSTYGSGAFGRWTVDRFGLPSYRYSVDEQAVPWAQQRELNGDTAAQHELGNDHIVAAAYNHGYTQLWSQDRLAQWANLYEPSRRHYAGGYGYLNVNGKVLSTLYLDRSAGHGHPAPLRSRLLRPSPASRRASTSTRTSMRRSATTPCCSMTSRSATRAGARSECRGSSTGT